MKVARKACFLLGVAFAGSAASAQEPAQPGAAESAAEASPPSEAGDIIVTAQRRGERLQKVPIAISAIGAEQLETRGLNNPASIVTAVPSLSITQNSLSASLFIRGIGQTGGGPNNENSVAMYIDDVYLGTPQMTLADFNNLEQVTVLKGPQGTLFGRNSTGGVVQFTTKDPSHDPSIDLALGYSSYDTIRQSIYATSGISEGIAASISGIHEKRNEGWGNNLTNGDETYLNEVSSIRGKLLLDPTEHTTIRISGDFSNQIADFPYLPGFGNPFASRPASAGRYDTVANITDRFSNRNYGGSIKLDQDLGFAELVSITAYRNNRFSLVLDQDTTPRPVANVTNLFTSSYWTQEVQLLSKAGSRLNWTIGAFYLDKTDGQRPLEIRGLAVGAAGFVRAFAEQTTKSYSGYAQATYPVFESTKLTAGLRYTRDEFGLNARTETGFGTTVFPKRKTAQDALTWRLSLDHNFTPDVLVYASYNRGVKSGGFNLGVPLSAPYDPEKLDAYEIGFKASLFDRRLRLNGAAFYYDYKDVQVQSVQTGSVFVTNAAAATIKGFEMDATLDITQNWRLSGSFSVLDGKYDDYRDAVIFTPGGAQIITPNVTPATPGYDASGEVTIQTPKFTGTLASDYDIPTSFGTFTIHGDVYHYSGAFFQPGGLYDLPKYTLANASIGWKSLSEQLELQVWVKNLTDEKYLRSNFSSNGIGSYIAYAAPRTIGVTARLHY